MLKIYKISCHSTCGSYFQAYLKSITVVAKNEAEAKEHVKKWLKQNGEKFIYEESKWDTTLLHDNITDGAIIDRDEDSDY